MTAVLVFVLVSVGLLLGKLARIWWVPLQRYFIPSSIIGGMIALIGGPEVWGRIVPGQPGGLVGQEVYDYCAKMPGFLINIVFAALFLGKQIPSVREVWRRAGPQVAFGQSMAWGMYVVGLGVTMLLLVPMYGVPPAFGTLLEIGFEGGHGTAAGLKPTFDSIGWEEGTDLALGVATVGVVMGVVLGMILINIAVRRGKTVLIGPDGHLREPPESVSASQIVPEQAGQTARKSKGPAFEISSIEPISLHLAYVGVAIGIGAVLHWLLISFEATIRWLIEWARGAAVESDPLMEHIPLFPLAMIGGILLQQFHDRWIPRIQLERKIFSQLQGVALDYLIVSALAALSLKALAANWQPLLILMLVGIAWCVGMLLFVAPRIMPDYWFERGMGDFGQSMGMTATGLLLMKVVDPDYRSPAYEAFGYKQLLFEPFVGGGLVTAMAVPLVHEYGPWPLFTVSLLLTVFWIAFGLFFFSPKRTGDR
jgi:glutamate:Na+ symporter, ESS family